ncbi:CLC_0170 family protein [Tepidibacter thalassicus]|uniref:Uncharacterized protein n=1 Tax=Tepidibacter thalassicus DSM 15285 TaxID=1123350 RepID=A0A1M5S2N5_9FIRM|nr:CLC_0170 family protein [Tepidibacter thalassicus]SHH32711.1 hypothetical protein SAMN02744040_01615 [Tepidibacter thalassicus DSM 15285]
MYKFFLFLGVGLYLLFWDVYTLKKKNLSKDYKIARFLGGAYITVSFVYLIYNSFMR